jgi:hypothetical protein
MSGFVKEAPRRSASLFPLNEDMARHS